MNKRLMTDMADAQWPPKMATDFCSVQCIMDNTGSLKERRYEAKLEFLEGWAQTKNLPWKGYG